MHASQYDVKFCHVDQHAPHFTANECVKRIWKVDFNSIQLIGTWYYLVLAVKQCLLPSGNFAMIYLEFVFFFYCHIFNAFCDIYFAIALIYYICHPDSAI